MVKGKTAPKKALLDSHDCLVGCDESAVSIFHLLSVNLLSDLLVFVSQAFAFISIHILVNHVLGVTLCQIHVFYSHHPVLLYCINKNTGWERYEKNRGCGLKQTVDLETRYAGGHRPPLLFKSPRVLAHRYVRPCWSLKPLCYNDPLHWSSGSYCEPQINRGDMSMPFSPPPPDLIKPASVTQSSEEVKTFWSERLAEGLRVCRTGLGEILFVFVSVCLCISFIHAWKHDIIFLFSFHQDFGDTAHVSPDCRFTTRNLVLIAVCLQQSAPQNQFRYS